VELGTLIGVSNDDEKEREIFAFSTILGMEEYAVRKNVLLFTPL